MRTATLIVGLDRSRCSLCGGNASPDDTHHERGGPKPCWAEGSSLEDRNGCGAKFVEKYFPYAPLGQNYETLP